MWARQILACLAATFVLTAAAAFGSAPDDKAAPAAASPQGDMPVAGPSVDKIPDEKPNSMKTDGPPECPKPDCVFTKPAHFPLPQFKADEQAVDDVGLLIYEGMRLSINSAGNYCVRFVASAPAVPVTLRLRFEIVCCHGELIETITLPPIHIPAAQPGKVEAGEYVVQHHGHAAVDVSGHDWHAHRSGTARFGYGTSEVP